MTDRTRNRRESTATLTGTRGSTVTRYSDAPGGLSSGVDAGMRFAARMRRAVGRATAGVTGSITPLGYLVAAVAVAGLTSAFAWGWAEGWVLGVAAVALLALAAPFLAGKQRLLVELEVDRDRVVAGSTVRASLHLTNTSARPSLPMLLDIPVGEGLIEAPVPLLRGHGERTENLTLHAAKRGVLTVGPLTIARGDPLGVLRRRSTWPGVHTIYVHPATAPIPSTSAGALRDLEGTATTRVVDSDLSFHALRGYVPGDSRRHVHWKSTAKTGQLMVRQYDETRRARLAVILDLNAASYSSEDEFELAVSAVASLGQQAIRDAREVSVTTSGDLPERARGRVTSLRSLPTLTARALLDALSEVNPSDNVMSVDHVATMTATESRRLSLMAVVSGSAAPSETLRRAAFGASNDAFIMAIRCAPDEEPGAARLRDLRVITIGALRDLAPLLMWERS